MNRPEQEIQIKFVEYVAHAGVSGLVVAHVPNGGKKPVHIGAIHKRLGVLAGMPDLFLFHQGHSFALEIKAGNGRLLPSQILTMARLREAGVNVAVAFGFDQCVEQLDAWRLTKKYVQRLTA